MDAHVTRCGKRQLRRFLPITTCHALHTPSLVPKGAGAMNAWDPHPSTYPPHNEPTHLSVNVRRPAKKPLLTEAMRAKRLKFAREHAHWGVEQWAQVMFTDESTFRTIWSSGSVMVRRWPGSNRYDPRFTVPTVKHAQSVRVWGGFSNGSVYSLLLKFKFFKI